MAVIDEVGVARSRRIAQDRDAVAWVPRYLRWAMAFDFLAMLVAGLVAFVVRFDPMPVGYTIWYVGLAMALPVLWVATLAVGRGYEPRYIGVGSEEFHKILRSAFVVTAILAMGAYATKTELARGYVLIALPLGTLLTVVLRYRLRKRLHWRRWNGECMRRVVAVGHRGAVGDLIRLLEKQRYHGMDIVGVCLPSTLGWDDDAVGVVEGVPVMGDFGQVAAVVGELGADSVAVLACPELDGTALRRLAWQIERDDVELVVAPALMDVVGPRISIRPVAGLPLLHVEHPELSGGRRLVKNLSDRLGALLALLALAPLVFGITVAIRIVDGGPVLFRQVRIGRDGRPFTILKFRTMVDDAEARKAELVAGNEHDGLLFKIREDPRVTRIGRVLRRHSLDELPQLFNVLRGDMSLVGPRPPLPEEVARYGDDDIRRRLVVKPGMTGLWQVSGRSDLSWEESVRLDLRYVENWSPALDLQIMWKTWSAVVRGSGAY
ncbi:sugar transferase [Thermomonospora umbrina]|uniref:Undecaprenyl-phosphate galactose phosphotransferase WbaP/exopolysaccharide biosynthesis polyprenyl glycosylphosphotransferase n=1 Tax=Thermomonospora umbrina TaxID=111806 RepID=A0A3D9SX33_9ACTN|nr:sugar transferase [Thermomonospora umbrina]REE96171.1 Undecaprenyl-phosphate galactose phosphotransferase WbaP/exopolysaccharide biosynthesis polyprenyl glycosylphosphotransferase [Thermomonospora umbrina]